MICVCIYMYVYVYIYICICVYIYTHMKAMDCNIAPSNKNIMVNLHVVFTMRKAHYLSISYLLILCNKFPD